MKPDEHPWRGRTREFATWLVEMPRPERAKIKHAERNYLSQRASISSPQRAALHEFQASMVGAVETVDDS
jgi:hypothetical protein